MNSDHDASQEDVMPRFSILLHDHPYWHWDFLLEEGDSAQCWRLLRRPCCDEPIAAERLAPHRLLYLEYEGPVSGNRGDVQRFGCGTYKVRSPHPNSQIELIGLDWAQRAYIQETGDGRLFWYFAKE